MNKPVYLDLSILDLCKTVMHEFWYDSIYPKYSKNSRCRSMSTDSFIVYVKQMILTKTLLKMLKKDLILQSMKYTNLCLKLKIKK